ncbi:O-antigen flippase Wzx [plant metagenome]|uniref:O-antigen flippase Wzx n=1 Tax=plant metagenome TaxID=1297885 RepID=A0A484R2P0_9ZZZZ
MMAVPASANRKFLRAVGVLVGGTGLSQAILFLAMPVLTRLYSPADFSLMATFVSVTNIIAVSACLRFDIAVPIPEEDGDAAHLLALALLSSCAISFLVLLAVVVAPVLTVSLLGNPDIAPFLLLIPATILAISWYNALQYWATRKQAFGRLAKYKLFQASAASGGQLAGGYWSSGAGWLLLGPALNYGLGTVLLLRGAVGQVSQIRLQKLKEVCRRYVDFPRYSAPESLANSCAILLPVLVISALAENAEAGFLLLAMQIMQAPMTLIGTSISQVYLSTAGQEWKNGTLGRATIGVLGTLLRLGVAPLLLGCLLAPDIFALVFGSEWRRSGELVLWMTPWLVLQFLASPVSMALHVTGRQRLALVTQVLGLALRLGAVLLAHAYWPARIGEAYAVSGAIFYFGYLWVIGHCVQIRFAELFGQVRDALKFILPAVFLALLAMWVLP